MRGTGSHGIDVVNREACPPRLAYCGRGFCFSRESRRTPARLAHKEPPPVPFVIVQASNGGQRLVDIRHFDKPKSTRDPGFSIEDDEGLGDSTEFSEQVVERFAGDGKQKIADVELHN